MSLALIVEDDVATADTMAALVANEAFTVTTAHSVAEARRALEKSQPDVVLLDLVLPDGSGLDLLEQTGLAHRCDVVLITGHPSFESSVQALRVGASDYLTKPVDFSRLERILARFAHTSSPAAALEQAQQEWQATGKFVHLWGRSPEMQRVYRQISRVAATSVPVLVVGPSGTGKELVASTVHALSRRRDKPFLALNCGAISPNLIESELFGHEKGSFTGADRQRIGFFERADGGTLFLDEITEMPPDLQVKLLRVLENGTFRRVGCVDDLRADVRIIAATNRVPMQAVQQGRLREDLLYRLNVFPIEMPPLHERGDDVVLLAERFIEALGEREGARKHLTPAAVRRLTSHAWPGNVRELRNAMQRAYLMTLDDRIGDEWLPGDDNPALLNREAANAVVIPLGTSLADAERMLIMATLRHLHQHKDRAAAVLGVSRKTLYNRLQEYAAAKLAASEPDGESPAVDGQATSSSRQGDAAPASRHR